MQIELNKQRATSDFDGKYPNMIGFVMGPGTQVVVNDIVKAANKLLMKPSSMEFDPVSARLKVLADIRQKVNYLIIFFRTKQTMSFFFTETG